MTSHLTPVKWIALVALVLFALTAVAKPDRSVGQEWTEHRGPMDAETRVAHMTQILDLTDEQSVALLQIMQEVDAERRAIHEQVMQVIEPDICALQISTEEQIAGVLTEDQILILQEYRDNRSDRRPGRGHDQLDCSAYQ